MNWPCTDSPFLDFLAASIQRICAAKPIWHYIRVLKPLRSFRKFSIIPGSLLRTRSAALAYLQLGRAYV